MSSQHEVGVGVVVSKAVVLTRGGVASASAALAHKVLILPRRYGEGGKSHQ